MKYVKTWILVCSCSSISEDTDNSCVQTDNVVFFNIGDDLDRWATEFNIPYLKNSTAKVLHILKKCLVYFLMHENF